MSPSLVFNADGSLRLVIGSPGGSRIIGYVAKTLIANLDWDMTLQESIDLGHVVNRNGATELEEDASEWLVGKLEALGHQIRVNSLTSGLNGVETIGGKLLGGADRRREGIASGR